MKQAATIAEGVRFVSLRSLLCTSPKEKLGEARRRVALLDRAELIERFRQARNGGNRIAGHVLAEALVKHGVPPAAWFDLLAQDIPTASSSERFDMFVADLMWLGRHHPDHARAIRYRRCKKLLESRGDPFHREAEYCFYEGRRPAWKLVGSLSLTGAQQLECAWLRSTPIKKRLATVQMASSSVREALKRDLDAARRTATFDDEGAQAALDRRYTIWLLGRIWDTDSPTEIAKRYAQATGQELSRQVVAKQIEKVKTALAKVPTTRVKCEPKTR